MKNWKIILSIAVIFGSGVVTGALVGKRSTPAPAVATANSDTNYPAIPYRTDFVRRAEKQLDLSEEQKEKIHKIMKESQERVRAKIGPQMRDEMKAVGIQIKAELTPEQQKKFEEVLKTRSRRDTNGPTDGKKRAPRNRPAEEGFESLR